MHTIKLKKFDILINDDKNSVIAIQSGNVNFDADLISLFELKLEGFLSRLEETVDIKPNATILDIGSGNSIFDIAIAKAYPNLNLKFILVDGNNFNVSDKNRVLHSPSSEYPTYNVWDPVFDNIRTNGLNPNNFRTVDPAEEFWAEPGSVDVVMTTSSWGWHYPIDTYLDRAYKLLKPGGYLIIRPFLNINNYLETVNEVFGDPLYLKGFPYDQLKGFTDDAEISKWPNYIDSTDPNQIMFYHAIWQKPLT